MFCMEEWLRKGSMQSFSPEKSFVNYMYAVFNGNSVVLLCTVYALQYFVHK